MKKEVDIEIRKAQNKENKEQKMDRSTNKDIVENSRGNKNKPSKQKRDAAKRKLNKQCEEDQENNQEKSVN